MDWVLDECSKLGIKVILSFVDNWKYPGGVDEYVDWSPTAPRRTQERAPDTDGDAEFVVSVGLPRALSGYLVVADAWFMLGLLSVGLVLHKGSMAKQLWYCVSEHFDALSGSTLLGNSTCKALTPGWWLHGHPDL